MNKIFDGRSVLVIGGARSGKSTYAQRLIEAAAPLWVYVATAEGRDAEMAERIGRHRSDRRAGWRTIEEPIELGAVLREQVIPGAAVVVDCLTLWLSNLMEAGRDIDAEIVRLLDSLAGALGPVVFVANEVGQGIVPATPLGREFRDAQGRLNQAFAAACDVVVEVQAGLPRLLKPAPEFTLRLH